MAQARQLRDNPVLWALLEQLREDKTTALLSCQDREKRDTHWQFLNALTGLRQHVENQLAAIIATGRTNG